MTVSDQSMHTDDLLNEAKLLRRRGLARPDHIPVEVWAEAVAQATPSIGEAQALLMEKITEKVVAAAQRPIGDSPAAIMSALVPLATSVHAEVMIDPTAKHSDRLSAARTVYEYEYGKPQQTIEHKGSMLLDVLKSLDAWERGVKSGTIIDTENILVKDVTPVDTFLSRVQPDKFVVGKKGAPVEQVKAESTGLVHERVDE